MSNAIVEYYDADGQPIPPHIAAEMSVLGAMMESPAAVDEVSELLIEHDFARTSHRVIWDTITDLRKRNEPADALAVSHALDQRQELLKIGGAPYLHDLIRMAPTATNVTHYAGIVLEAANNRRLSETANRLHLVAESGGNVDQAEVLERAQFLITELQDRIAPRDRDAGSWANIMQRVMDEAEDIQEGRQQGLPTGFADLDEVTNGLHSGHLTVFGARPGVGKSTILADIARHVAFKQCKRVLFISLEMSEVELGQRMMCAESSVRIADYRGGRLTGDDWGRLAKTMGVVSDAPLHVERVASRNVWAVTAFVRSYQRRYPDLAVVIVDYLQKLKAPDSSGKRADNRVAEVGECSWALKELAVEVDIPVVTAAQLNRTSVDKPGEPPRLNHLRESGEIEQDSDEVILIHRPDAEERDCERAGEADFIVAKNRFGPNAVTVTVAHQMHYGRFVDMAKDEDLEREQRSAGAVAASTGSRPQLAVVPEPTPAAGPRCAGCRQVMTPEDATPREIDARIHADCAAELDQ